MSYCARYLGESIFSVDNDYAPLEGEILFPWFPSEQELQEAFPGRLAMLQQREKDRLALVARTERDRQLREVYDAGTQMVRRELETTPIDPVYEGRLILKRDELHAYARALQAIPEQGGFPEMITWPAIPTEDLS